METELHNRLEALAMEWEIKADGIEDALGENDPLANVFRACARDLHCTVHHNNEVEESPCSLSQQH
jgi:hypothetical protein